MFRLVLYCAIVYILQNYAQSAAIVNGSPIAEKITTAGLNESSSRPLQSRENSEDRSQLTTATSGHEKIGYSSKLELSYSTTISSNLNYEDELLLPQKIEGSSQMDTTTIFSSMKDEGSSKEVENDNDSVMNSMNWTTITSDPENEVISLSQNSNVTSSTPSTTIISSTKNEDRTSPEKKIEGNLVIDSTTLSNSMKNEERPQKTEGTSVMDSSHMTTISSNLDVENTSLPQENNVGLLEELTTMTSSTKNEGSSSSQEIEGSSVMNAATPSRSMEEEGRPQKTEVSPVIDSIHMTTISNNLKDEDTSLAQETRVSLLEESITIISSTKDEDGLSPTNVEGSFSSSMNNTEDSPAMDSGRLTTIPSNLNNEDTSLPKGTSASVSEESVNRTSSTKNEDSSSPSETDGSSVMDSTTLSSIMKDEGRLQRTEGDSVMDIESSVTVSRHPKDEDRSLPQNSTPIFSSREAEESSSPQKIEHVGANSDTISSSLVIHEKRPVESVDYYVIIESVTSPSELDYEDSSSSPTVSVPSARDLSSIQFMGLIMFYPEILYIADGKYTLPQFETHLYDNKKLQAIAVASSNMWMKLRTMRRVNNIYLNASVLPDEVFHKHADTPVDMMHLVLNSVDASLRADPVLSALYAVSYTHLTLPTIYSV